MSRRIFYTKGQNEKKGFSFKALFFKLFLISIIMVGAYGVYLSAQIAKQFDGPKWQVPAQIYARPLTFSIGRDLARSEVIKELQMLGYRKSSSLTKTGDYQVIKNGVQIYRRAFEFVDGYRPAEKLQVSFNGDKISAVRSLDLNQTQPSEQLEPLLIDRMLSSELEDRILVRLEDVPQQMIDALLLVEDRDFYSHFGIKPTAIMRALLANIKAGKTVQGGSTLTQQLVKNYFLSRERSIIRKLNEALMSVIIELNYDKDEILQAYLNEVYLGQHGNRAIHGFGLASYFYFARPLNELELHEMALLVGMIKGPSYFNPRRYPERARKRRDLVLEVMQQQQVLALNEFKRLSGKEVKLADKDQAVKGKHPGFMQMVRRELGRKITNPELLHAGIKVFTSMDPVAQRNAEKTVIQGLKQLEKRKGVAQLQAAVVVSEIASAEIKALVADRDISNRGFNRALDMRRPVGSLLKPAVYLTALEDPAQYNLASRIADKPVSIDDEGGKKWQPLNSDKKFRGEVSLLEGLYRSLNVPAVNLGMELGLYNIQDTIHRLGIAEPLPDYPSLILGAVELSPLQINQAYHTIAGQGVYQPLHTVLSVMDSNDSLIYQKENPALYRFDQQSTYLLNYALHQVSKKGTAKRLSSVFKRTNFAAKTGTTDDYRDSWFTGYERNSVATIWIGRDDNKPMWLSGTSGAMTLFVDYFKNVHPYSLTMPMPDGVEIVQFDQQSGQALGAGCQGDVNLPAISRFVEATPCSRPQEKPKKKKSWFERWFGD